MTLLITGATGFIGRALVARVVADGLPLVIAARAPLASAPAPTRIVGEIDGATDWRAALEGVTTVIHLAGRAHRVGEPDAVADAAHGRVNDAGVAQLARAVAACGVARLVLVSSIKASGERTQPGRPFDGLETPAPEDAYGRAKLAGERAMAAALAHGPTTGVVLRPPLVLGPGATGNLARLVTALRRGLPLPLGAVANRRSLIARANLVDALLAAATRPALAPGMTATFVLADDLTLSSADLARGLARAMGREARLPPVPVALLRLAGALTGRAAAVRRLTDSLVVDAGRFRAATGWVPRQSPDEAFAEAVG
jgi:UDP-glucose 4-epimerase